MFTSITVGRRKVSFGEIGWEEEFSWKESWVFDERTLAFASLAFAFHPRQRLRDPPKQRLDIRADLGTRLDEQGAAPFRFVLAHLRRHLALIAQIRFVAYEHDDDVVAALATHVVNPFARVLKRFQR